MWEMNLFFLSRINRQKKTMKLSRALSDLVKYTKSVGIQDVETESRSNWNAESDCSTKKCKGFCSCMPSYQKLDGCLILFDLNFLLKIQIIHDTQLPPLSTVVLLSGKESVVPSDWDAFK